jgi:hypothetical protein
MMTVEWGWLVVAAGLGLGIGIMGGFFIAAEYTRKRRPIDPSRRHPAYRRRPPGGNEKWPPDE